LWRCHQKYCNPQAFFVAVSGLFQEKKLFNALDEAFASRQGAELALTPVEGTLAPEELHFDMLRDQVTLLLARPSKMTLYNDDYLPLSILNIILFYSLGSRLYKIREEQGLFYSLFGGFALDATSFSSFDYICTQLNPENVDSAHKEIIQALHNVKDNGITESELADAKQIYLNSLINLFADTPAVTQAVSSLKLFGLDLSYYQKVIARLATLRAADINRVAKDYINPDTFLKITVGKNSK